MAGGAAAAAAVGGGAAAALVMAAGGWMLVWNGAAAAAYGSSPRRRLRVGRPVYIFEASRSSYCFWAAVASSRRFCSLGDGGVLDSVDFLLEPDHIVSEPRPRVAQAGHALVLGEQLRGVGVGHRVGASVVTAFCWLLRL
eukprot:SAG22_NODE_3192_length_1864_cov_20.852125_1_plen_140_part_00